MTDIERAEIMPSIQAVKKITCMNSNNIGTLSDKL